MILSSHARERAKQRFGIDISNSMYRRLVLQNKDKIRTSRNKGCFTMFVNIEGKKMLFIMGKDLGAITVVDVINTYDKWAEEINYGIRSNI
jgi:hypothetical protein